LQTYSTPTGNGPSSSSTTDQAKDKAQEAAGQAKEKAGTQLRSQVDRRSSEAGQRVGGFASDVRSVSDQLREQGKDQPARLAEQAADRAERVSGYLTENDAERILGDVEDFGRRQPWVVIAGGAALGLVASRFLKASSSRRYEQRRESSSRLPARTPDVARGASGIQAPPVTVGAGTGATSTGSGATASGSGVAGGR
jgi:gas vesicle protein